MAHGTVGVCQESETCSQTGRKKVALKVLENLASVVGQGHENNQQQKMRLSQDLRQEFDHQEPGQ